ncbi:NUDIX hydrolase [Kribbella sp. NPDC051952]|uniref:NUDIX hydrolase n=1 Tax=Kribbella sp. NPDC051952 TaxID=3154851 RepID=UPI0034296658
MGSGPSPIVRKHEHAVFSNEYGDLFNDEVEAPSGRIGNYLRWRWASAGVVIAARSSRGTLFISTHRYSPNLSALELPRGGRGVHETVQQAAARELLEESGYAADDLTECGTIYPETGLIENAVTVVRAYVEDPDRADVRPAADAMESVEHAVWLSDDDVLRRIADGSIQCAISISAYTIASLTRDGKHDPLHDPLR